MTRKQGFLLVALAAFTGSAAAQVTPSDRWTTRVTLYGFFPSVHAKANFDVPDGGSISTERDPDSYLTNLQSTFMGAFEFRKHPWSVQGDFIYLNFGDLKARVTNISNPGGEGIDLAVNTTTSMQAITYSFGGCERTSSPVQRYLAQQANAQGITWVAASGTAPAR